MKIHPSYTSIKHFPMMMKQVSGSTCPDTITDQLFPMFHPSFNPQNNIINSIIIFYMNNIALEVGYYSRKNLISRTFYIL